MGSCRRILKLMSVTRKRPWPHRSLLLHAGAAASKTPLKSRLWPRKRVFKLLKTTWTTRHTAGLLQWTVLIVLHGVWHTLIILLALTRPHCGFCFFNKYLVRWQMVQLQTHLLCAASETQHTEAGVTLHLHDKSRESSLQRCQQRYFCHKWGKGGWLLHWEVGGV